MSPLTDSLRHLASLYGVLTEYHDNEGTRHEASPEALVRVLRSLGASIENPDETTAAIREREQSAWKRRVEPVQLFWDGHPVPVRLRLPGRLARAKIMGPAFQANAVGQAGAGHVSPAQFQHAVGQIDRHHAPSAGALAKGNRNLRRAGADIQHFAAGKRTGR